MREPPEEVSDQDVSAAVAAGWRVQGSAVHLPVGFGAHHWRVGNLFVTWDRLRPRHSLESLETAYGGAAELARQGLEFVLAPLPSVNGTLTVNLADGRLSVTPWTDAPRAQRPAGAHLLARLHTARHPDGLPRWRPLVGPDLADELAELTSRRWDTGPHGERARAALRDHLTLVARWVAAYHSHAAATDPSTWVATHGEPHERNLLVGPDGPLLVDWETPKLAPRERDLRQAGLPGDAGLLEMFDLEWRLDEVSQYAAWFAAAHTGHRERPGRPRRAAPRARA